MPEWIEPESSLIMLLNEYNYLVQIVSHILQLDVEVCLGSGDRDFRPSRLCRSRAVDCEVILLAANSAHQAL